MHKSLLIKVAFAFMAASALFLLQSLVFGVAVNTQAATMVYIAPVCNFNSTDMDKINSARYHHANSSYRDKAVDMQIGATDNPAYPVDYRKCRNTDVKAAFTGNAYRYSDSTCGTGIKLETFVDGVKHRVIYCHLVPGSYKVANGALVNEGTVIGTIGNSGRSYGAHLHIEVYRDNMRQPSGALNRSDWRFVQSGALNNKVSQKITEAEQRLLKSNTFQKNSGVYPFCGGQRVDYKSGVLLTGERISDFTIMYNPAKDTAYMLRGAIAYSYWNYGACDRIGLPTSDEGWVGNHNPGWWQHFDKANLYWARDYKPAQPGIVREDIRDYYEGKGGAGTAYYLGYPEGQQWGDTSYCGRQGTLQHFQRGKVFSSQFGTFDIAYTDRGWFDKQNRVGLGGPNGTGWPKTTPYKDGDNYRWEFEKGTLWSHTDTFENRGCTFDNPADAIHHKESQIGGTIRPNGSIQTVGGCTLKDYFSIGSYNANSALIYNPEKKVAFLVTYQMYQDFIKYGGCSFFGYPQMDRARVGGGDGWYQHFKNANLYHADTYTNAQPGIVKGNIRERFESKGGTNSYLGYPQKQEVYIAKSGACINGQSGHTQAFQYGRIFSSSIGLIDMAEDDLFTQYWDKFGGIEGALGWPKDESDWWNVTHTVHSRNYEFGTLNIEYWPSTQDIKNVWISNSHGCSNNEFQRRFDTASTATTAIHAAEDLYFLANEFYRADGDAGRIRPFCGGYMVDYKDSKLKDGGTLTSGAIIYNPAVNKAFMLKGGVAETYWNVPNYCSALGLPVADEINMGGSDYWWGGWQGFAFKQEFDKGMTFYYEQPYGIGLSTIHKHYVAGKIWEVYEKKSPTIISKYYGLPISDPYYDSVEKVNCQKFQHSGVMCDLIGQHKVEPVTQDTIVRMKSNADYIVHNQPVPWAVWINLVRGGGEWDYKSNLHAFPYQSTHEIPVYEGYTSQSQKGMVINGTEYTNDVIGNINYGYTGQILLGGGQVIDTTGMLLRAGGFVQAPDPGGRTCGTKAIYDPSTGKYTGGSKAFGDYPEDQYYILVGIRLAQKYGYDITPERLKAEMGTFTDVRNFIRDLGCPPFDVNNPPVISVDDAQIIEGTVYNTKITANDLDGDTLTFSLVDEPLGMVVNSTTGTITWVPASTQVGIHTITVAADDGEIKTNLTYEITVIRRSVTYKAYTQDASTTWSRTSYSYTQPGWRFDTQPVPGRVGPQSEKGYWTKPGTGVDWFNWFVTPQYTGNYKVIVFIPSLNNSPVNNTTSAKYRMWHSAGYTDYTVNQNDNISKYVTLGTVHLEAGQTYKFELSDKTGESTSSDIAIAADMVMWELQP